ncbi:hypothetical protein Sru01_27310 [Sphaerisporangium rufum]|uniref:Uncharacterized protein n=1 Tax=Sphaerisporangium rufum TaxID=1381558 RepID=A0A919R166_9ACTN|nr:hypothetical protein Sru01_27310 [Sphaerisporangium rufum]
MPSGVVTVLISVPSLIARSMIVNRALAGNEVRPAATAWTRAMDFVRRPEHEIRADAPGG